jgi:membrane protein implicated in regulation of membrane protease activity
MKMRILILVMASAITVLELLALIFGVFPRWPIGSIYRADEPTHFWSMWWNMGGLAVISWICVYLARRPRPPKAPYEK